MNLAHPVVLGYLWWLNLGLDDGCVAIHKSSYWPLCSTLGVPRKGGWELCVTCTVIGKD